MNKCILMGRLTRDPEVKETTGGTTIGRFSLAVDRYTKKGEDKKADFINCVAFGNTAKFAEKYTMKGQRVLVEGRIQTGTYEKDGEKRYTTDIVVNNIEFADGKMQKPTDDSNLDMWTGDQDIPM